MSSGPSHILVLSQVDGSANVVPAWREFIGPADTEEARREKPERLVTGNYSLHVPHPHQRKHERWD